MNTIFPLNSMKILEVFLPQTTYYRKLVESLQEERNEDSTQTCGNLWHSGIS